MHINKSFKLLDSNGGLSVMLASTFATVAVNFAMVPRSIM